MTTAVRKTVWPESRFISPRKPEAPWRTISLAGGVVHRDLALEDRDERVGLVADLEQRLADRGGPLLAVRASRRQLRAGEDAGYGRPCFLHEIGQLVVEARGEPPLEDRLRLDQARVRHLLQQHAGVAEGMDRVGGVADDQRRLGQLLALLAVRRGLAQQQALQHGERGAGALAHPVEADVDQQVGAGDGGGEAREDLEGGAAEAQPDHHRREGGGHRNQGVVEHRHLEEEAPGALGRVGGELEADVGAERGAADDGGVELEVVEQGGDLAGEERHRVEPQVLGPVGAAVAEQVDG